MRTIKIKTQIFGMNVAYQIIKPAIGSEVYCKAGENKDASVCLYDIINVPDNITDDQVLNVFKLTTIYKPNDFDYIFDYTQLGEGFLVKK